MRLEFLWENQAFIGLKLVYISKSEKNNLTYVYNVINQFFSIIWFKNSVKDTKASKVEDWPHITEIF